MIRPRSFKHSYIALHNIPYIETEGAASGTCGGVLCAGQVVWTDHLHQQQPSLATAFIDEVGVVRLDPRWLVSPELYQLRGSGRLPSHRV